MAPRKQQANRNIITRRRVLKTAAAAAGAWPFIHVPKSFAEDTIGNWPDGVKGDTAFVGITTPDRAIFGRRRRFIEGLSACD
jgi:hypothetical protein